MDEKTIKELVGKKIRLTRKKLGYTQEKLAELINMNSRQIAVIESGKSLPSLGTLRNLAEVFGFEIKDFFDFEHLQNEDTVKQDLLKIIDTMNPKEIQTMYLIAKNLNVE